MPKGQKRRESKGVAPSDAASTAAAEDDGEELEAPPSLHLDDDPQHSISI